MDRRSALRAAAAMALGTVSAAGCHGATDGRTRPSPPQPPPGPSPTRPLTPSASPTLNRAALGTEVTHGPRDRANVALTFHGQGDPASVRQLLDEVERAGGRVTVLAVGSWLDQQPAMAGRILDGGHELGNHTQNHLDLASMGAAQAFGEINSCAQRLKALTGSIGTWFRPSQTMYSTAMIKEQATRAGYPTCLSYDLDSLDYTDPSAAAVVRTVLGAAQNGSIVSLHCGHAVTVAAMPEILDGLRGKGLRPVTMTELLT
jgi:peptidoglycan/xylan/chitin deacetylase (PgdA/CDA1 family)